MSYRSLAVVGALVLACNVTAAGTTGGVDLPERGACPRGIVVVSSDFQSSELALLSPRGDVKSAAFLSSASTAASALAAPLSGDVGVSSARGRPNELVIVDALSTNVLTFVDVHTAVVRAQLPIGTGFEANPRDYLQIDEHKAYVGRLSQNTAPGREAFDSGGDLLLIDPSLPAIIGSLPMPAREGFWPNPAALKRVGDDVLVTLWHARPDYLGMADGEIVAVASGSDTLRYRLELTGLQNCGRVESSPSGRLLAVACMAYVDQNGAAPDVAGSGLVLFDATQDPPAPVRRFAAADLLGGPIQSSVEFVSERVVLLKSQTALDADADNQLLSLDLDTGETAVLATAARSASGRGFGIAFGGMSCQAACGDPCLVSDASRGRLLRFNVEGDELSRGTDVVIDGAGLPPAGLTPFW